MGLLKAKVDGAWVEIAGVGMPPGGTTGQILTKTSAADYATAWTSTPPVLANNSFLQGYRADGTTAQGLIGIDTANAVNVGINAPANMILGYQVVGQVQLGLQSLNDIYIGSGLAAGKNIYVPRLTVQGPLTLTVDVWTASSSGQLLFNPGSDGNLRIAETVNALINGTAGSTTFARTVQIEDTLAVRNAIYKVGVGTYTFPDFVFEHHFTGGIERFRDAPGAQEYEGLWPLDLVEEYAREHWRLPHHAPREDDRVDVFRRTHDLLAELERLYLHMFDHEKRLAALEGR